MGLLGAVRALKEDGGIRAELVDHLPTGTAWRTRQASIVGHRDRLNFNLRSQFGYGGEDRRALGAVGQAVRSVFHIATGKDSAVGQQDRGADPEFGVWSMRVAHNAGCRVLQSLP